MNKEENQIENGEIEIFNQRNMMWKGKIKNGEKWNGKGTYMEYKDKNNNIWECTGK